MRTRVPYTVALKRKLVAVAEYGGINQSQPNTFASQKRTCGAGLHKRINPENVPRAKIVVRKIEHRTNSSGTALKNKFPQCA